MAGGPIAVIEEGDRIAIDIPRRRVTLKVSSKDIEKRLSMWRPPRPKITKGYMARYAQSVSSGGEGAIVK
ncbi:MAG: dihydroxy-acid dehydratase, partial [Deltaproteobacteria bacterium]|nr:dihydroxy-acid dehydratase [Deltaproteobacteria bacterium]